LRSSPDAAGTTEEDVEAVDDERQITRLDVDDGLFGDAAIKEPDLLRGPEIGADARDGFVDGLEGVVADLGLASRVTVGPRRPCWRRIRT